MSIRSLFLIVFGILSQYRALAQTYTLLNDASALPGGACYQLTPDSANRVGGVYQNNSINLSDSFDYKFCIFLGCNAGAGDGMCFILTNNITAIGAQGAGLGYSGLTGNSLAVEYDTYQNSWDPDNHHMALEWGGQVEHPTGTIAGPAPAIPGGAVMTDCAWHTTEIIWNVNTHTYTAYFDTVLRLSYTGDIVANFFAGNPVVNWGWSGSTASGNAQQFCTSCASFPTGVSGVHADLGLNIFPNPNQGNFMVTISSATMLNGTLSVVDQLGRAIHTQNIEVIGTREIPLELGNIAPGAYLLVINIEGAKTVKQFTVK